MDDYAIVRKLRSSKGVPAVEVGTPEHRAVERVMAEQLAFYREFRQLYREDLEG